MSLPFSRVRLVAFGVLVLLLTGCGAKAVPVSGKLVVPPKIKLADTDSIQLSFIPDGNGQSTSTTASAKDLTFNANVVPGTYKIAVVIQGYAGMKDTQARNKEMSTTLGSFSPTSTTLKYEVTADANQSITVDLAKGNVVKN